MEQTQQLYDGKAKRVFATQKPEYVIVSYKDDATAFDGKKKGSITGKGSVNNKMSNFFIQALEREGIPTHFVQQLNDRESPVKKSGSSHWKLSLEIFPPVTFQDATELKWDWCLRNRLNKEPIPTGSSASVLKSLQQERCF